MPLLKYICEDCNNIFEELVFGEPKPVCPQCGSTRVKRYYQGKCYFGKTAQSGDSSACSCSGGSCCPFTGPGH